MKMMNRPNGDILFGFAYNIEPNLVLFLLIFYE